MSKCAWYPVVLRCYIADAHCILILPTRFLPYIALRYLRYILLHYVALRCNTIQYNTVQYDTIQSMLLCIHASTCIHACIHALHYIITLRSITLHYFTLHYITLHHITLHYITCIHTSICDPCPTAIQAASMLLRTGLRTTSPGKTCQNSCANKTQPPSHPKHLVSRKKKNTSNT